MYFLKNLIFVNLIGFGFSMEQMKPLISLFPNRIWINSVLNNSNQGMVTKHWLGKPADKILPLKMYFLLSNSARYSSVNRYLIHIMIPSFKHGLFKFERKIKLWIRLNMTLSIILDYCFRSLVFEVGLLDNYISIKIWKNTYNHTKNTKKKLLIIQIWSKNVNFGWSWKTHFPRLFIIDYSRAVFNQEFGSKLWFSIILMP